MKKKAVVTTRVSPAAERRMFAAFLNHYNACDDARRFLRRRKAVTFAQAWDVLTKAGRPYNGYRDWGIAQLIGYDNTGIRLADFLYMGVAQRRRDLPDMTEASVRTQVLTRWRAVRRENWSGFLSNSVTGA